MLEDFFAAGGKHLHDRAFLAASPEDCGGIPGFYAQLEALADPGHPDHDDAKEWFGDFEPNCFDDQPSKTGSPVSPTAAGQPQPEVRSGDQLTLTSRAISLAQILGMCPAVVGPGRGGQNPEGATGSGDITAGGRVASS
jgi:hypothetical protein